MLGGDGAYGEGKGFGHRQASGALSDRFSIRWVCYQIGSELERSEIRKVSNEKGSESERFGIR